MANARHDSNNVPTLIAALNSDGITPVNIKVNPTTGVLQVSDGATGTNLSGSSDPRDDNRVPVLMGVSSADGITPCPIYADSNGNLLVKST